MATPLIEKLELAAQKRKFDPTQTDAFRLFSGEAEGIPGLVIEKYGPLAVLQYFEGKFGGDLREIANWVLQYPGVESVYAKFFPKVRSAAGTPEPFLAGKKIDETCIARENDLRFYIRPNEPFSVGLFLDQRDNRKFIAERIEPGMKVLNLFSYTCAFSVSVASKGALTINVDVSKRYVEWGRSNLELNRFNSGHLFFARDARDFLERAHKKGEKYDLVICDPPSFSRNDRGEVFSLEKDFMELAEGISAVVAPQGALFFSCNFSSWDSAALEGRWRKIIPRAVFEPLPPSPEDIGGDLARVFLRV